MTPEDELINEALEHASNYWGEQKEAMLKALSRLKRDDKRRPAIETIMQDCEARRMTFISLYIRRNQ